jgi:hypothetical protein
LFPKYLTIACIYGLQKIYKKGIPLKHKLARLLSSKLKILVGQTDSFVKDSASWMREIKDIKLKEEDILVSFDMVSLFAKIPTQDAINVNRDITNEIVDLASVCLKSTYFSFQGTIYEQIEGIAMASPLSPIIANL